MEHQTNYSEELSNSQIRFIGFTCYANILTEEPTLLDYEVNFKELNEIEKHSLEVYGKYISKLA